MKHKGSPGENQTASNCGGQLEITLVHRKNRLWMNCPVIVLSSLKYITRTCSPLLRG